MQSVLVVGDAMFRQRMDKTYNLDDRLFTIISLMPFIPSSHLQRSRNWIPVWRLLCGLWLLTVTMLQVASPSLANPLAGYCLTRVGPKQSPTAAQTVEEETAEVRFSIFSVRGERFHVAASYDRLLLTQGDNPTPLAQIPVPQREFRIIDALILGEDSWLWIDGDEIDYMARLDLQQQPPTLGQPVALPDLTEQPCPALFHFLGSCMRAQGRYSNTLNWAFITGHRVTLLGWPSLVSFEIVAGEAKRLPGKFHGTDFEIDIPHLSGSLLRGRAGEALFYDGVSITPLLTDFPDRPKNDTGVEWLVDTDNPGRTFLKSPALEGRQPFLMELQPGPTLNPIPLPDDIKDGGLYPFVFSDDPHLWVISKHSVAVQIDGRLQTVAIVPDPYFTHLPERIGRAPEEALVFSVGTKGIAVYSRYFLVRASPTTPCMAPLNPNQPLSLENR